MRSRLKYGQRPETDPDQPLLISLGFQKLPLPLLLPAGELLPSLKTERAELEMDRGLVDYGLEWALPVGSLGLGSPPCAQLKKNLARPPGTLIMCLWQG